MNLFEVLKSVCDHIKVQFPDAPIYVTQMPQGFSRPAFSVGIAGFVDRDLCQQGMKRRLSLSIVHFAPQDERKNVDTVKQLQAYHKLLNIFQQQSLPVGNRRLKIDSLYGGPREAEIYLTVRFEYTFTPETEIIDYELMQQFFMNYR